MLTSPPRRRDQRAGRRSARRPGPFSQGRPGCGAGDAAARFPAPRDRRPSVLAAATVLALIQAWHLPTRVLGDQPSVTVGSWDVSLDVHQFVNSGCWRCSPCVGLGRGASSAWASCGHGAGSRCRWWSGWPACPVRHPPGGERRTSTMRLGMAMSAEPPAPRHARLIRAQLLDRVHTSPAHTSRSSAPGRAGDHRGLHGGNIKLALAWGLGFIAWSGAAVSRQQERDLVPAHRDRGLGGVPQVGRGPDRGRPGLRPADLRVLGDPGVAGTGIRGVPAVPRAAHRRTRPVRAHRGAHRDLAERPAGRSSIPGPAGHRALFALANSGIVPNTEFLALAHTAPVTPGIIVGYLVGKPLGTSGARG